MFSSLHRRIITIITIIIHSFSPVLYLCLRGNNFLLAYITGWFFPPFFCIRRMPPILGSEGFLIRPFRSQYWRNRTGSQKVHSNLPVSILAHWTLSSLSHSRIYLVLNPSPVALNISFQSTSLMEATGTKSLPRLLMKEVSGVSPLLSATQKATDWFQLF